MLHKQHGGGLFVAQRGHDGLHHGEFFVGRHATGGFVQQQQLGRGGERDGNVEQLAHAAGQFGDTAVAVLLQGKPLQQGLRPVHGAAPARRLPKAQARLVAGGGHQHVFQHAELAKQLRNLEGARHAQAGNSARVEPRNVLPLQADLPRIGLEVAGDHVHKSGLARAVAADEAHALPGGNRYIDVGGGHHRVKLFVYASGLQHGSHRVPPLDHSAPMPWGRKRITTNRKMPSASCQVLGK